MRLLLLFVSVLFALTGPVESTRELEGRLYDLAEDPDPRVRFQLAFTLGELSGRSKIESLKKIALQDCADYWVRTAILSSVNEDAIRLFEALLLETDSEEIDRCGDFMGELAKVLGTRGEPDEIAVAMTGITEVRPNLAPRTVTSILSGLAEGFELGGKTKIALPGAEDALVGLLNDTNTEVRSAAERLSGFIDREAILQSEASVAEAIRLALDADRAMDDRKRALQNLKTAQLDAATFDLTGLLEARQPDDLAVLGLEALNSLSDDEFVKVTVGGFQAMSPAVKEHALDSLFARTGRLLGLLRSIDSGEMDKLSISRERRPQLLLSPNKEVSDLAALIYGDLDTEEDLTLFEKYRPAIDLPGDPEKGHATYRARCVFCHKVGEEGVNLGPDWSSVQNNTRDALLINILYPNRDIDPGFLNYVVETTDGELLTGILVSSGESSVTLRRAGGEEDTVLRKNIGSMKNTELSIMPVGLEAGLSAEDMADLLAFIQSIR
jgi:putative heme-binding domain-containing protein